MADPNSPLTRFTLWRAMLPPALRILLTVNIATYVLYVVLSIVGVGEWLRVLALPLVPSAILKQPWTVLTYGVTNVYAGFWGLISFAFGAYWLNWLGREYEQDQGSAGLLGLYVFGTLGGALLAALLGLFADTQGVEPGWLGTWFGVWGPALAVLCATAALHPNRQIGLFLLGVISLKWIAIAFVVLELAFSKDPTHLGAALFGVVYARAAQRGLDLGAWARPLFGERPSRRAPRPERTSVFSRSSPPRAATASREAEAPRRGRGGAQDVDAILDKILEKGYDSLTRDEREALDRASRD